MKTIWKVVIILVAVGLVLSIVGVAMGASRWVYWDRSGSHIVDVSAEKRITELDLEQIKNIEIKADFSDIEFITSDKYGIDICYRDEVVTWGLESGNLTVSVNNAVRVRPRFFDINLSFTYPKNYIKVYLPADAELDNVSVYTSAGDIKAGSFNADYVQIDNDFGRLDVNSITCNRLKIKMSAGDFSGRNLVSGDIEYRNDFGKSKFETINAKSLNVNCSAGDIRLSGCKVESIDVNNDFGKITATDLISSKTNIYASAGDIDISGEFSGQTVIKEDFGSVRFTTSKAKEDYSYDVFTDFGSVMVDNSRVRGGTQSGSSAVNSLYITNSAGDIHVNFGR